MDVPTLLTVLAELAPASSTIPLDLRRVGMPVVHLSSAHAESVNVETVSGDAAAALRTARMLAGYDALGRDERILRQGRLILWGRATVNGRRRRVFLPLQARPIRLDKRGTSHRIVIAGDVEPAYPELEIVTPVLGAETDTRPTTAPRMSHRVGDESTSVADPTVRPTADGGASDDCGATCESETIGATSSTIDVSEVGRDGACGVPGGAAAPTGIGLVNLDTDDGWPPIVTDLAQIAAISGLPEPTITGTPPPDDTDGLWLVTGSVVYLTRGDGLGIAPSLREWSLRDGIADTALSAVYGLSSAGERPDPGPAGVLPLDPDQQAAARAARRGALTVISGAPGCGKSHTLAAIAHDAIAAGESVLMVTQSPHAADVLADLLSRHPGPKPVVFGNSERRIDVATALSSASPTVTTTDVRRVTDAAEQAQRLVARAENAIRSALADEIAAATARPSDILWFTDFPRLLNPDIDLGMVDRLFTRYRHHRDAGHRLRQRLARHRLGVLIGAPPNDDLAHAIDVADAHRAAARIAMNGTDLGGQWRLLIDADDRARNAAGIALAMSSRAGRRRNAAALRAMAALAAALRAGRASRRVALESIDTAAMLSALPLWISTVTDVEDVLPAVAGMFDLVIIDEASHIDQIRAAPALLRARRAVIAGDPRQLRFVSFVGDATVSDVLAEHGAGAFADRLDVRRQSTYDVAAGASAVIRLREHYRGVPHLIGFSALKFYGGHVAPVTRHPRNDRFDAIDVHRILDGAVTSGVNKPEVDAAMTLLGQMINKGHSDIAVITPFRAQADAIERAILDTYTVEEIIGRGLRAGTVHAFQGSEASTVIVVLGIVDGDSAGRRRFVADPNLFNVMTTRARHSMHLITTLNGGDGIIGEFLRYAEKPPVPPTGGHVGEWAASVADELERAEVTVRRSYPVGSWTVDLCVGDGNDAVGVICAPHPDGIDAHLARHRVLLRAGWTLIDAFASRHDSKPVDAALAILSMLRKAV